MNKWIYTIALVLGLSYLVGMFTGNAWLSLPVILAAFGVVALLGWSKTIKFFPLAGNAALVLGVVGLVAGFGALGMFGIPDFFGLQTAAVGGAVGPSFPSQPSQPSVTAGECQVSDELLGKSSTVTVYAEDRAHATPTTTVNATSYVYTKDGSSEVYKQTLSETDGDTLTAAVGDVIVVYPYGTSYYGDRQEFCVDSQSKTITIEAYNIQDESDMAVVLYDDDATTALSAGTSSEYDYTDALGADEAHVYYFKLRNNGADEVFDWLGVGTAAFYNISSVEVVSDYSEGSGWRAAVTPTFMKSVDVLVNETSGDTINKDYSLYKRDDGTLRLMEWESEKVKIEVNAHASNDPDGGGGTTSLDGFAICALDAQHARDPVGNAVYDIHDHSSSEANVGLSETLTSPLGKEVCTLVEAT